MKRLVRITLGFGRLVWFLDIGFWYFFRLVSAVGQVLMREQEVYPGKRVALGYGAGVYVGAEMGRMRRTVLIGFTGVVLWACLGGLGSTAGKMEGYRGKPFEDSVYHGGPQKIPGQVECAYYDLGGEGVAYHTDDKVNSGSGKLNPADGTYLNEFRMNEAVSTSYTKFRRPTQIDDNPYDKVTPPENQLYVGWTKAGEWFNMTVDVARSGVYKVDLLYTSRHGGTIELDRDGQKVAGPIQIPSTEDAAEPIAWRQWHHWNLLLNAAQVKLPKGVSVLTLRILTEGNMNLAYLDFEPTRKGAEKARHKGLF